MKLRTALATVALSAVTLLLAPSAQAATVPALAKFDSAFASVTNYTFDLRSHETKGSSTQDRVYEYSFMKPHFAKTLIKSGDGKGSGGVWAGGDQVSGHQGGFLSGIHLKVDLHDGRAVSLRGYTIPDGLLQNVVEKYETTKGKLTEEGGPVVEGQATDKVTLVVADPASNGGVTRQELYISKSTHMPVREIRYAGSTAVVDDSFLNLKLNTGLTQNDFPF